MDDTRRHHLHWFWLDLLTVFAAVIFLSASTYKRHTLTRPNMITLSNRLHPLFNKTKPICFGRFTIDVPATATVVYGPTEAGFPIEYFPDEANRIPEHVATEVEKIEKDRFLLDQRDTDKFAMFGKVIDGAVPGQKLVFGSKNFVSLTIASFIPIGKDLYIQDGGARFDEVDENLAELNDTAKKLRPRTEDEMPNEPGLCIAGGFIPSQYDYEKASIGIRLKEFPDVHFSIAAHKNGEYLVESLDIEIRIRQTEKDTPHGPGTWYSRIDYLRRGPRQLAHWKGSEVLTHLPSQAKEMDSHEFHFTSIGAINDRLNTRLDIQLDTGVDGNRKGAVKPSLTDEEAVALWDKLVATLRIRPTR